MMAPDGMTRSLTGGGDCLKLGFMCKTSSSLDPELNLYVAPVVS